MKTRLILDINKTQYAQLNSLVTGRVGDKASNTVDVYVVDGFIPYNLTGSDVYFECAKPDNTSVRDKNGITMIDAAKGHFEYTFPAQTFASVGKSKQAYFTVEKNSTVKATTQDFVIVSLPDALTNRIPSQTYISQLEELIWQLEQIELDLLNSAAYREAHDAKTFAEQAKSISESVQEQLNQIVINSSIDPETKQARVDETGAVHQTLKERIDSGVIKIKEDTLYKGRNYVRNGDFKEAPFVTPRSTVYSMLHGVTNPSHNGNTSYQVTATGYETSSDPTKDFAFVLTDSMTSSDTILIDFFVYPKVSNKTITIRMAYSSATNVNLGPANQWNKISLSINLSSMTNSNNYLYFNMLSSFTMYMSELTVQKKYVPVIDMPDSFRKVNNFFSELHSKTQNSKGSIENLIANAQTYAENTGNIVYGNNYTAYDPVVQQVNGKYQIDCSSFANLMIRGIPWDKTRYIPTNTSNQDSKYFFLNMNPYEWRYAHQMGRFAYEYGYSYKPNADLSNVQPGDILFFHWNNWTPGGGDVGENLRANNFMGIDHVAVVLHRKNESNWATLQFDNNISTVYYDASNEYMSQAVLGARFPFSNVESKYEEENLLLNSDIPKSITTGTAISSYKATKNFVKGRYYTFLIDGNILTDKGYFVLQVNGKTVYSDSGKIGSYKGITALRFPYLLDDISDTITLSVGAPSGTTTDRIANVNWCSMYEGYVRNVKEHKKPSYSPAKDFALKSDLVTDLINDNAPYYKYIIDKNKMFINFSLPFSTLRTGSLTLGSLGSDVPSKTQRLPINLIGANNEAINGILQVSWDGNVSIIPYSGTTQWKSALASGCVFMK
ncbi:BppU family phage baseplate upper protein [Bacillus cereus]|uniref:BppU family phage baseplate upper protein n=1 Tax=Bacillus cereus TaxID=1396 RepID=UPI000BF73803|nr:BppU family phage baseplate upper protein [Bacillus cereus]PFQ01437.1 hypothetical protein COK12_26345 [Bacillus cereus]